MTNKLRPVEEVVSEFMKPKPTTTMDGKLDQEFIVIKEHVLAYTTNELITQDRSQTASLLVEALEDLKTKDVDGKTYYGSHPDVIHDKTLDLAQTIVRELLMPKE